MVPSTEFFTDMTTDDAIREVVDVLSRPETAVAQRFDGLHEAGVITL